MATESGGSEAGAEDPKEFAEEAESLWRIAFGPLFWVAHFVICYAATTLVCTKLTDIEGAMAWLRLGIAGLTILTLAGIALIGWRAWQQWDYLNDYDYVHDLAIEEHRHEFLGHASFLLALISFVGVVYVALPALFIGSCL